jgi:hypothetical protein
LLTEEEVKCPVGDNTGLCKIIFNGIGDLVEATLRRCTAWEGNNFE